MKSLRNWQRALDQRSTECVQHLTAAKDWSCGHEVFAVAAGCVATPSAITWLKRELDRERRRAKTNGRNYSLNRHLALLEALRNLKQKTATKVIGAE